MNFHQPQVQSISKANKELWRQAKALHGNYKEVSGLTSRREFTRAAVKILKRLAILRQRYYFGVADQTIAKFLNYSGMKWARETIITRDRENPRTFQLVPKSLYNDRTENKGDRVKIAMNPVNKLDMIQRGLLPPSSDGLHFTFPTLILNDEHIFTANTKNYGYADWESLTTGTRLDDAAKAWRFLHEFIDDHKEESLTVDNCGIFMFTFSTFCTIRTFLNLVEWNMVNDVVNKLAPDVKPVLFKKLLVNEVIARNITDELKLYVGPDVFSNVYVEFVKKNAEAINLVTARLARPTIIWKVEVLSKTRIKNRLDMASNV